MEALAPVEAGLPLWWRFREDGWRWAGFGGTRESCRVEGSRSAKHCWHPDSQQPAASSTGLRYDVTGQISKSRSGSQEPGGRRTGTQRAAQVPDALSKWESGYVFVGLAAEKERMGEVSRYTVW